MCGPFAPRFNGANSRQSALWSLNSALNTHHITFVITFKTTSHHRLRAGAGKELIHAATSPAIALIFVECLSVKHSYIILFGQLFDKFNPFCCFWHWWTSASLPSLLRSSNVARQKRKGIHINIRYSLQGPYTQPPHQKASGFTEKQRRLVPGCLSVVKHPLWEIGEWMIGISHH